jgi:spore maturation protein CgeB
MAHYGDAASLRLFEAAASEACIVTDSWPGIDRLFVVGGEILVAHDSSDMIRFLRDISIATAQAIGARAYERLMRDHTAGARIAQLLPYIADLHHS